jgi:hypothetical protein
MADVCGTALDVCMCVGHGLSVDGMVANNHVVFNMWIQSHFNTVCFKLYLPSSYSMCRQFQVNPFEIYVSRLWNAL